MDWIQQWQSKLNKQNGVAPLVRTGGSRHTGLAALPYRNIHFLYGIFANEMFYTTKSIWMPTGFHWLWNYTITSLFLVTGTQSFIYVHIIAAMIIMIPLFYIVIGKTRLSGD